MPAVISAILACLVSWFKSRYALQIKIFDLRHQLAVCQNSGKPVPFQASNQCFPAPCTQYLPLDRFRPDAASRYLRPSRGWPSDATWAATIRDSAKFAAAWRMAWGVALTCGLLAGLFWGLGQLYPHVFLTEWAHGGGVKGIEAARWLFGAS